MSNWTVEARGPGCAGRQSWPAAVLVLAAPCESATGSFTDVQAAGMSGRRQQADGESGHGKSPADGGDASHGGCLLSCGVLECRGARRSSSRAHGASRRGGSLNFCARPPGSEVGWGVDVIGRRPRGALLERESELAALSELIDRACAGDGHAVVIAGTAGHRQDRAPRGRDAACAAARHAGPRGPRGRARARLLLRRRPPALRAADRVHATRRARPAVRRCRGDRGDAARRAVARRRRPRRPESCSRCCTGCTG